MPAESTKRDEVGRQGALGKKGASGGGLLMLLFSATIFISAALLFLVEPMFAKFVLPSFGGTPAVWTGSMMFFQATLLVGYLYVHATTTWLGARRQAILHLVVVLLPILVLPLAVPGDEWAPSSQSNPIFLLLGLLAVSVGLPFFAISTTNPLVQRWLSDTDHPAARDPYFLYRASNLGSVIGLLGYPVVVGRVRAAGGAGLRFSRDVVALGAGAGPGRGGGGVPERGPGQRGRLSAHCGPFLGSPGGPSLWQADLAAPGPVGGVDVRAVEPDAGGNGLYNHRHNTHSAAVGNTALFVPLLVRYRLLAEPDGARPGSQRHGRGVAPHDSVASRSDAYRPERPVLVARRAAPPGLLRGSDGLARGGGAGQATGAAPDGVLPVGVGRRRPWGRLQRAGGAGRLQHGDRVPAGDSAGVPVPSGAGPGASRPGRARWSGRGTSRRRRGADDE